MDEFVPHKKPSSIEKVVATIRLDITTLQKIDSLAYKTNISRNEMINQCIAYALSRKKEDVDE